MKKKKETAFIPYKAPQFEPEEMLRRSKDHLDFMCLRRTIRHFSDRPVDREVIENIIMAASSAPSGAHKQPWTFALVSNPDIKKAIREAAEKEEHENYNSRMSDEWLKDLEKFETNWNKPYIETAPWIIVIFKKTYDEDVEKGKQKNYYVNESVGIACGFLISAIHHAGLVTLTHTPSPMRFLHRILQRPENEKPFLLIPVGYPAEGAGVPDINRKTKEEVIVFYE